MRTCLITGGSGMAASYLIEYILENQPEWNIVSCRRRHSDMSNVAHIENERLAWVELDLTDAHEVYRVIEQEMPDKIFHFGAQSFVPRSWKAPTETINVNLIGTLNILEAIKNFNEIPIHICSSSEVYGDTQDNPISERSIQRPLSPYAVSKLAMEKMAYVYYRSYGVKAIITRAFNHTGARRGEEFVCAQICKQAVEIKNGKRKAFYLGNLDAVRDFSDVRDIVRAYWLATELCEPGKPYNISSERGLSIRNIVNAVALIMDILNRVEQDPKRMRPADIPILIGNSYKFRAKTGWNSEYKFEDTLKTIIDKWSR